MSYTARFEYQDASADVVVWEDGKTATLSSLYSKFRGRGAGRKVVKLAIAYAVALGVDLVLEVQPFGDAPGPSAPELKAFYMSLGFENQGGDIMVHRRSSNTFVKECSE